MSRQGDSKPCPGNEGFVARGLRGPSTAVVGKQRRWGVGGTGLGLGNPKVPRLWCWLLSGRGLPGRIVAAEELREVVGMV